MCGISGAWSTSASTDVPAIAERMIGTLHHRGPDGQAVWHTPESGLALGHARLAIVDLSPAGEQPMRSASGRYCIVLNGEIYNHTALRNRLDRQGEARAAWRGHSDTETFLAAIEAWGLDEALRSATGMFAFALWDGESKRLSLVRDRFGEKPLYYAQTSRGLVFGSELKAVMASGWCSGRLSRDAAAAYLRFNNVPAPRTVFEDVRKLLPGHCICFTQAGQVAESTAYWSVAEAWRHGRQNPFIGGDIDAVDELERRLSSVVRDQMLADVPLGAFLSGGIDSSTIVALMQAQSARPVRTFSIGFDVAAYNEAEAAKAVARHLGTDHTELYVTAEDALRVIPSLPRMYCEPFADSSQIPTHLVARMARRHVKVALSGDAGDEVFAGYNRYQFGPVVANRMAPWPVWLRKSVAAMILSQPSRRWDRIGSAMTRLLPAPWRFKHAGSKLMKLARALPARDAHGLYTSFVTQWPNPSAIVRDSAERFAAPDWQALGLDGLNFAEQMMVQDAIGYLPNDILVKVDRAAMAISLEGRTPFLDHNLYEFAASLPFDMKLRKGTTKWLVRQVLHRHVPQSLIDRPKVGFGIPLEHWLRKELRDWAESLLSTRSLQDVGVFDPIAVRKVWQLHLSDRRDLQHELWCVLMYQAWHAEHAQRWGIARGA